VQDVVEHLEAARASHMGFDPARRGLADASVAGTPDEQPGCRDRPPKAFDQRRASASHTRSPERR
jgi:hypothetical protein